MMYLIMFLLIYIMLNGLFKIGTDCVSLYKWITKKLKERAE